MLVAIFGVWVGILVAVDGYGLGVLVWIGGIDVAVELGGIGVSVAVGGICVGCEESVVEMPELHETKNRMPMIKRRNIRGGWQMGIIFSSSLFITHTNG